MKSRRHMLASLGALGLTGAAGGAGVLAAPNTCRFEGYRTSRQCVSTCSGDFDTLTCQIGVVFPTFEEVRGGVVAGAILGGIIAFLGKGNLDQVLQGAVIGGLAGGVTQAATRYVSSHMERARGNAELAAQTSAADRRADDQKLSGLVVEQVLTVQEAKVQEFDRAVFEFTQEQSASALAAARNALATIELLAPVVTRATESGVSGISVLEAGTRELDGRASMARPRAPLVSEPKLVDARSRARAGMDVLAAFQRSGQLMRIRSLRG